MRPIRYGLYFLVFILCFSFIQTISAPEKKIKKRKLNTEEKAFFNTTMGAIPKLFPEAPKGWKKTVGLSISTKATDFLLLEIKPGPWPLQMNCNYDGRDPMLEKKQKALIESMAKTTSSPERQAELMRKMAPYVQKMLEAMAKGDKKEIEQIQKEIQKVAQESDPNDQLMNSYRKKIWENIAEITIYINYEGQQFKNFMDFPVQAPIKLGLRQKPDQNPENLTARATWLFFGPWKRKDTETSKEISPSYSDDIPIKVHNIAIHIDADSKVADAFIANMDMDSINSLIQKK